MRFRAAHLAAALAWGLAAVAAASPADDAALDVCTAKARAEGLAAARACNVALASGRVSADSRAHARYRAASLALDLGETAVARAEAAALVHDAPATQGAHRALRLLRALRREEAGPGAEADMLLGIASRLRAPVERAVELDAPAHPARELYVECLVEAARIRLLERKAPDKALRLLERAQAVVHGSHWIDDVWIWRARAHAAGGAYGEALKVYQRLLAEQESSWFVGSYDSMFRDDAIFEMGQTFEAMGRSADARAAYAELVETLPTSRLADDAAFRGAVLASRAGDVGALRAFLDAYPESPHRAAARRQVESP